MDIFANLKNSVPIANNSVSTDTTISTARPASFRRPRQSQSLNQSLHRKNHPSPSLSQRFSSPAPPSTLLRPTSCLSLSTMYISTSTPTGYPPPPPTASATSCDVVSSDNSHQVINLPEKSATLNVILHAMYDLSVHAYSPSFDVLSAAITAFPKYGIDAAAELATTSPLYPLVIGFAPLYPADVYAIAAENGAHDLAVNCSPQLLSFALPTLRDDMAARIGPSNLKKLFFLHLGRSEALEPLLPTPYPHPETSTCTFEDQRAVRRAWAIETASLAWEARPDISAGTLDATLSSLAKSATCQLCKDSIAERVKTLVVK